MYEEWAKPDIDSDEEIPDAIDTNEHHMGALVGQNECADNQGDMRIICSEEKKGHLVSIFESVDQFYD